MTKYPLQHGMEEVTEIDDELEAGCAEAEKLKNLCRLEDMEFDVSSRESIRVQPFAQIAWLSDIIPKVQKYPPLKLRLSWAYEDFEEPPPLLMEIPFNSTYEEFEPRMKFSFNSTYEEFEEPPPPLIGGRRVVDAIVVSSVILLSFVYFYLIGYMDRGGSTAGSSSSLDFRDIYISILLFQAAFIWIKFRDVIPRGAVYHRRDSNKYEPRIKLPVTRGVGGKSKRIPLDSYDTFDEGAVVYKIAAFYCNKPRHRAGRLDLGGGAYFTIPTLSVDPNLPYKEKVKQVADQVLKVYAEFEEEKTSRNLPPHVLGQALEMQTGEGHQLLPTPPIQQPVHSPMDSAMQGQGSQHAPIIHNGVDFNNPSSALLAKTQHELLEAYKQNGYLKAQVSQLEVENMGWEFKHTELERKYLEREQIISQLERENGLLNQQIMQSQLLPALHPEEDFDTNVFLTAGHEVSI